MSAVSPSRLRLRWHLRHAYVAAWNRLPRRIRGGYKWHGDTLTPADLVALLQAHAAREQDPPE